MASKRWNSSNIRSIIKPILSQVPDSFEKTLHILARMRYFDKAWELMVEIGKTHPFLLTLKSMSIMLCRIAKFRSYEETLDAFEKMEKRVFVGRKFGAEEFNVLLRAFCTVRKLKEAKSVFCKDA
ncbi:PENTATRICOPEPTIDE REPEAT-CONTAINING PROTEIN [Salix koriyanagi]|uniref:PENTATRICOPEPTIDE REPEAT-CONTAINING PROTEIN n=1 Tax=Salix koriyanagi TaxID=2511006 RepID=A0A9Q0Q7G6_9ROSI|nr:PENTATRICOPEPTIDE REPEAT-CONTAINING PROTEIN [Salix koriyanagi]